MNRADPRNFRSPPEIPGFGGVYPGMDKRAMARGHVRRLLFTVFDCADEWPVHPEDDEPSDRLAYQVYLLGEALATLLETTFEDRPDLAHSSAVALLGAIRKRVAS